MRVTLNINVKQKQYNGIFALDYFKKSNDMQKLLEEIKKGIHLKTLFNQDYVFQSVKNRLIKLGYIDGELKITADGESFIVKPYLEENESGFYQVDTFEYENNRYISSCIRLENRPQNSKEESIERLNVVTNNEFLFNKDRVLLKNINTSQKGLYDTIEGTKELKIDITRGRIGDLTMGENMLSNFTEQVKEIIRDSRNNFVLDESKYYLNQQVLEVLTTEQILNKEYSFEYEAAQDVLNVDDAPLYIDNLDIAKQFIYKYLYTISLNTDLSLAQMNSVVHYDLFSSGLFSQAVINELMSFSVNYTDFKTYLNTMEYQRFNLKLKALEILLETNAISTEFDSCRSFNDIFNLISNEINLNDCSEVTLIQGYGFLNKNEEKLNEIFEIFDNYELKINYIDKCNLKDNDIDKSLINRMKEEFAINYFKNADIKKTEHDRYMVFKSNSLYHVYRMTGELQDLFSVDKKLKATIISCPRTSITYKEIIKFMEVK